MKAKFGSIVVDGRGKLGGHVYSKNRAGAYVRTKVTPVNPQTTTQVAARAILTQLSQDWSGLTAAQRAAWNAAVNSFQRTDIFGDLKSPTGLNLYTRLNAGLLHVGAAVISTPPASTNAPDYPSATPAAAAGAQSFSVAFTVTPVPANTNYVIETTQQVSAGKSFVKNLYRTTKIIAAAGASPSNIAAVWIAKNGALVVGKTIGVRIYAIDTTTGIRSQATSQLITVAA